MALMLSPPGPSVMLLKNAQCMSLRKVRKALASLYSECVEATLEAGTQTAVRRGPVGSSPGEARPKNSMRDTRRS